MSRWWLVPAAVAWITVGWLVLVGCIAIWGKPSDDDQRTLCFFIMMLWPLSVALNLLVAVVASIILSGNWLVKAACAPGDALSNHFGRFVASAKRVHVRRLATPEMQAAKRELDAYLRGEP